MGVAQVDIVGASEFLSLVLPPEEEGGESETFCIQPIFPVVRAGIVDCNGGQDLGISTSQNHVVGIVGENKFTAQACEDEGGMIEAAQDPHPNRCIGPVFVQPSGVLDSGEGALLLAPNPAPGINTAGVPALVSVDFGPCSTHENSELTLFGFVSADYIVQIVNPNALPAEPFVHRENGENLSCANWDQEDGQGRLVLGLAVLHGASEGLFDVVTVFELDD